MNFASESIKRIYSFFKYYLDEISPNSTRPEKLRSLLNEYDEIPIRNVGFPEDSETSSIWIPGAWL